MSVQQPRTDLFSARIRDEAVEHCLFEEAHVQEQFVSSCAECFEHLQSSKIIKAGFLGRNAGAATASETAAYWQRRAGEKPTPLIQMFELLLCNGVQPIFAAVSLRTLSMGPTLSIPVPYLAGRASAEHFKKLLWLNSNCDGHGEHAYGKVEIDEVARTVSHALANISYSALIDDQPITRGWLAKAHVERKAIYIPDVSALPDSRSSFVASVSGTEEPFLGMASLLYLPLFDPANSSPPIGNTAPAVLMLWSPVPRRWDNILKLRPYRQGATEGEEAGVFTLPEYDDIRPHLWARLRWLVNVVFRDNSDVHKAELELLSFVLAMESWSSQQGGSALVQFHNFFHGSLHFLKSLRNATHVDTPISIAHWIDDMLRAPGGFVKRLVRNWDKDPDNRWRRPANLKDRLFHFERWNAKSPLTIRLGQRDDLYDALIESIAATGDHIAFDEDTALYIASEPANNISKFADNLVEIRAVLTQRYIKLQYVETPTEEAKSRLLGSDRAFRRYYAGRRGIASPPLSSEAGNKAYGTGLGLWLYRVFAARSGVFRKLYVSPDGKEWRTEIAVPLHQVGRNHDVYENSSV